MTIPRTEDTERLAMTTLTWTPNGRPVDFDPRERTEGLGKDTTQLVSIPRRELLLQGIAAFKRKTPNKARPRARRYSLVQGDLTTFLYTEHNRTKSRSLVDNEIQAVLNRGRIDQRERHIGQHESRM